VVVEPATGCPSGTEVRVSKEWEINTVTDGQGNDVTDGEPDQDEEDQRSGNCQHCGELLHWDGGSGSFRDDAEDEFCENGMQHERAEGA
jgi:hypothetical protein